MLVSVKNVKDVLPCMKYNIPFFLQQYTRINGFDEIYVTVLTKYYLKTVTIS